MKLAIVLYKPAAEAQLLEIIKRFALTELHIFVKDDPARIDIASVRDWECVKNFPGTVITDLIDFESMDRHSIKKLFSEKGPFGAVAVPVVVGRAFWYQFSWLKKMGAITINLADGASENGPILYAFLRLKSKLFDIRSAIKTLAGVSLIRLRGRADICFHPYYPLYTNCFARISYPCAVRQVPEWKARYIDELIAQSRPKALLIGGFDLSAQQLEPFLNGISYIATSKGKEIIINGERRPIDFFLTAEEVVTRFEPQLVVGTVSDAVAYSKFVNPQTRCIAIRSKKAAQMDGTLFNFVYKRQTRKLGVEVVDWRTFTAMRLTDASDDAKSRIGTSR